ncbi:MAG: DUF58 domain-containing protein, partial [Chloroflexi bacterium]|nr:DUF58 domain-containing protein [Chloroflexota bacterium]
MIPTFRGIVAMLLIAPVIAAGAFIPGAGWLALAMSVVIVLLFVLDAVAAGDVNSFQVERIHDDRLSLAANNPIRLRVVSLRRRRTKLTLRDEPPEEFIIERRILEGTVLPRQPWEAVYHVRPIRRGDYTFGDITLRWVGPLGLLQRQATLDRSGPVKVYPNLLDVRRYDLMLRRNRLEELGLRSARIFGEGREFERLRDYTPDDEYRRINWKATARRHTPITTEYQTERSQIVMCLIDTGRMMQSPIKRIAKLDYVVNAVLLLSYVAAGMGDKVGAMTFADDVYQYIAPRQGKGQFYRMLEVLYAVDAQPVEPDYRRSLTYLALKQRRRALVVIFTDLSGGMTMDALVSHTARLARTSLPFVVTISDPE